MPVISRSPKYCLQKAKNRPDRAYVVISGKRIMLGRYDSPESYKKYAELINAKPEPEKPKPAPAEPTINMLMAGYLAYAINKYGSEKALEVVHLRGALKILRRTHGDLPAKRFGPKAFMQMRLAMIEADWSRGYIAEQCARIKRLVAWGVVQEVLDFHAHHALDAVPGLSYGEHGVRETEEVQAVPDDVLAATLPHVGPVVRAMILIQLATAMRPGELVQLAIEHIDRTNPVWLFRPPKHKTKRRGKKRIIAIGPRAQTLLQKYLFASPCFPYTTASYRRAIARGCDRAFPHPEIAEIAGSELPARKKMLAIAAKKRELQKELAAWQRARRWHPHQIRHAAAEEVREAFGLEHAQHVLGHARADVTQLYARGNIQKAVEVAKQIG